VRIDFSGVVGIENGIAKRVNVLGGYSWQDLEAYL